MKKLKYWNGRSYGKYSDYHIYICAYTQKQAIELLNKLKFPEDKYFIMLKKAINLWLKRPELISG